MAIKRENSLSPFVDYDFDRWHSERIRDREVGRTFILLLACVNTRENYYLKSLVIGDRSLSEYALCKLSCYESAQILGRRQLDRKAD